MAITNITVEGRLSTLPDGAKVWGGFCEGNVYWRFTTPEGENHVIALSHEAVCAMIDIYHRLVDPSYKVVAARVHYYDLPPHAFAGFRMGCLLRMHYLGP